MQRVSLLNTTAVHIRKLQNPIIIVNDSALMVSESPEVRSFIERNPENIMTSIQSKSCVRSLIVYNDLYKNVLSIGSGHLIVFREKGYLMNEITIEWLPLVSRIVIEPGIIETQDEIIIKVSDSLTLSIYEE